MMFSPELDPFNTIPLHRLLKRQEITALLKSFAALLPEGGPCSTTIFYRDLGG